MEIGESGEERDGGCARQVRAQYSESRSPTVGMHTGRVMKAATDLVKALALLMGVFGWAAMAGVADAGSAQLQLGGRDAIVYLPEHLPAAGSRSLVLVLHGGLGNAERIEKKKSEHGLNLDALADRDGFVVAYLNGTPVSRHLGQKFLGWNAGGGCCGVPSEQGVDDVGYVVRAVKELVASHGVDPQRVYGFGHSNGAMMIQRVVCEAGVFSAIMAVSGPLNLPYSACPKARARRVLAVHGAEDENVPIPGGVGPRGIARVNFQSEAHAQALMEAAGASYELLTVPGADHYLNHLDKALEQRERVSVADRAVWFFGLEK
jgi:poly(3-hydroxybutyrate) depolymerase